MDAYDLNVSAVTAIFKESLKVEPSLKTVGSIFENERYRDRVNYAPSFQRNYVWDKTKASYFIESVLLGTEIPPIVLFKDGTTLEVIDGRQRYETLLRFIGGEIALRADGLKVLGELAGMVFSELQPEVQNRFIDTKLRLLTFSVVNEPHMSQTQKEKVKREIFNRYNAGIKPLTSAEIERAAYEGDPLTEKLKQMLSSSEILSTSEKLFGLAKKGKQSMRDRINIQLAKIRPLVVMPLIPIRSYAYGRRKAEIVSRFLSSELSRDDPDELCGSFQSMLDQLGELQECLITNETLHGNRLVNEATYWAVDILRRNGLGERPFEMGEYAALLLSANDDESIWDGFPEDYRTVEKAFSQETSHYDKAILSRYRLASLCAQRLVPFDYSSYLEDSKRFKEVMGSRRLVESFESLRLTKPDPHSESIDDILANVNRTRFLIRPSYQRSEVKDIAAASYLIESILLGIKIPPIFVFKRRDGISEVVDGQQRLLTIIGFLGKKFIDEDGVERYSEKDHFKLKKLRVLSELNGMSADRLRQEHPEYYDKILDFNIDIIEIDEQQNERFSPVDLFQRLNQKPFPIEPNSFEMWNAYIDQKIADRAKEIVARYPGPFFAQNNVRMKNEELVSILAYASYASQNEAVDTVFSAFVRGDRIDVRLEGDKLKVTKALDAASDKDVPGFLKALSDVDAFLAKLVQLTGSGFSELRSLVSPRGKLRKNISNRDAYILWMMLLNVTPEDIDRHKSAVLYVLRSTFVEARSAVQGLNPTDFFESKQSEMRNVIGD